MYAGKRKLYSTTDRKWEGEVHTKYVYALFSTRQQIIKKNKREKEWFRLFGRHGIDMKIPDNKNTYFEKYVRLLRIKTAYNVYAVRPL